MKDEGDLDLELDKNRVLQKMTEILCVSVCQVTL